MAKFTVEVELDWMNEESIDEEIKDSVINQMQKYLSDRALEDIKKTLDDKIAEKLLQATEIIDKTIDEYIQAITSENISKLMIAEKTSTWSDEIEMIPISEYIGKKFEDFCNRKRYDKNFNPVGYEIDRVYSLAEVSIQKYLKNVLEKQVSEIVKNAQKNAEMEVVRTLEQTLKNNLAEETVKKMNIPQVLKNLQEQYVGIESKED